jgi:hypothetical protein
VLSVPLGGQFEQILNSRYLEHVGYGLAAAHLHDPAPVTKFLDELPAYEAALSEYRQDGNQDLFQALDGLLDRAGAGVL